MGYFKNIIYERVVCAAHETNGEDPTTVEVTEETNCFAVWLHEPIDHGTYLMTIFPITERNQAIEWAVDVSQSPLDNLFKTWTLKKI